MALETDPVCGMQVDPAAAPVTQAHAGRTYYFCCSGCRDAFASDPAGHLGRAAARPGARTRPAPAPLRAPASPPPPAGAAYTCPMHPEVARDRPGSCPICGMALEPRTISAREEENPELRPMTRRLVIGALLTAPLLILDMFRWRGLGVLELVLATPVVLYCGWPFFERAAASAVNRSPNMFTLIALGTGTAYLYSLAAIVAPGLFPASARGPQGTIAVYFETGAVITVLVLVGQVLELRARGRAGAAIRALLRLAPDRARRVREGDDYEEEILLENVRLGDRLRIRPGERVPVDGAVLEGRSSVDESLVTGESVPVPKGPGDLLIGSTVNGTGSLVMRADRVGADTLVARIVRLVAEAQRSRAPIQRLADAVSAWFVPAVVLVAGAACAVWATAGPEPRLAHAIVSAVAVLIIACPCALGLATPMSIMVGIGRGALSGALIRDAEALEILERVDTLVIDKTGTLTEGRPRLLTIMARPELGESQLLRLAASLERASEHPLAAAFADEAAARGLTLAGVSGFESIPGLGVRGAVEGHAIALGSETFLRGLGLDPAGSELVGRAGSAGREGQTVVYAAIDGRLAGILGAADPIKASAPGAVASLHRAGLRIVMVTGDDRATAEAVAGMLEIDEVEAGVLPEGKAEVAERLKRQGRVVAMAGDGVNDAPALARADVGIAMGTGSDVAILSAGVVLVQGDLRGIVRARRLSRAVMRNIRQNLFFAFAYNVVCVPVAAGALYPAFGLLLSPAIASAAMSLSSVTVIANALRLRRLAL